MTSREIIKRILHHESPPRIGFDFLGGNPTDFCRAPGAALIHPLYARYSEWGRYPELLRQVPGFSGEVKMSPAGNIFGRFEGKTQGECIKGALQDGWEELDRYELPALDPDYGAKLAAAHCADSDRYVLTGLPFAVFAPLRDGRHMDNALMDTVLEPDNVRRFLDRVTDLSVEAIRIAGKNGVDGAIIYDDLGMQHAMFFSPETFRALFKPYYKKLADALHESGMDFFVHSCGKVTEIIPDFIEAGVDAFQFDQPELHTSDLLAREFGRKAAFYCPVDIQKIMPTGDRKTIEEGAVHMVEEFKACGGSLIVMDYGNWQDLNVEPEWQQWARDAVIRNAWL